MAEPRAGSATGKRSDQLAAAFGINLALFATEGPDVLRRLREYPAHHFDLEHSTFQLEPATYRAHERAMHG